MTPSEAASRVKHKPLGEDAKPEPSALRLMQRRGGEWFAYQNHDLSHPELGRLCFLKCGEGCTFAAPPERMPDTSHLLGWRYLLVGKVNLETGAIQ